MNVEDIPFPETRAYVEEVLSKRTAYRDKYGRSSAVTAITADLARATTLRIDPA